MKLNQVANYFVVLMLSVAAAGLYFGPSTKAKPLNQVSLPSLISLNLNQQVFLTKTFEKPEFNGIVENLIREQQIDFKSRLSPVYSGLNSTYLMTFFETTKSTPDSRDIQFVIFKRIQEHYRIVATLRVTSIEETNIKLSYGSIDFLDQEAFNLNTLKLAQTLELEENF